jgi:hypothetical protein
MMVSRIATVEVPFEALVRELGARRAVEFVSEIRRKYGDSVVELRKATEKLTMEEIEKEIRRLKKEEKI